MRWPLLGGLATLGLFIAATYSLKFIGKTLFGELKAPKSHWKDLQSSEIWALLLLVGFTLWFGFKPAPMLNQLKQPELTLTTTAGEATP